MSKKNVTSSKYRKVKITKKNIIAKNRKEYAKIVILAVFLLVLTIGGSYALFQTTIKGTKQTEIVAGTLKVDYTDKNSITLNNASPLTDSEGLKQEPYTFTIKNIGTLNGKYTIYLEEKEGNTLDKSNIKYSIKEGDGDWSSPVLLSSGLTLKENRILEKEKEATYQIKMWLKEDAPNEVQGQTYSAKVVVDVVQTNIENIVTTNPIIKLNGESVVKINQNEEYVDAGISGIESTEKIDISKVKIRYEYNNGLETIDTNTIDTSKVGIYYIYYEVENSKGIKGVATRVVNVVRKGTNIPSITLKGEEEIVLDYKEKYIEAGYEARDVEDGILTDKVVVEGVVNSEVAGTYIIKYIVIDSEGNTASVVRKVIVNKKTNSFNATVTKKEIENISAVITIKSEGNEGYYAISSLDKKPGDSEYKKIETDTKINIVKNGRYYVYVKSKTGNITKKIIDVDNIDETKPTCTFSDVGYLKKGVSSKITLTCTDPADIVTKAISKDMLEISNTSVGQIESIQEKEKIDNGYQYKISIIGSNAGDFSLKLRDNSILDKVGNANTEVESNNIKVVEMILSDKTMKLDLNGIKEKQIKISGTNLGSIAYESSNEDVVTVTKEGLVKAVGEGQTTIKVTESNGKIEEQITVTVVRTVSATFNKNGAGVKTIGGTVASCEITTANGKCSVVMPTIETNNGYTAIGWNANKEATTGYKQKEEVELEKDAIFYTIVKKDAITLTATFNKNGATSLDGKPENEIEKSCVLEVVYNDEIQASSCKITSPTIEASTETPIVIGYSENKDAIVSTYKEKEEIEISEDKTYYALTKNTAKRVTVTFNKNGAKTLSGVADEIIEKSCTIPITYNGAKQNENCSVVSPTIEASTETPTVIGYSDSRDEHTNIWSSNTEKQVGEDKTYYAQTKKETEQRTVNFKIAENSHVDKISLASESISTTNDSITATCTIAATYNGNIQADNCSVKSPIITVEKGYKNSFFGTSKEATSGVAGGETVSSINKTYYARALTGNNYKVNYYDGETLKGITNGVVGKEFKLASAASLSLEKEGYTFKGWTTGKESSEVVYKDEQTVKDLIKDDNGVTQLYAVWKDETKPVCIWAKPENITTGNMGTVDLTCTDLGSGISRKVLTETDFEISNTAYGTIVEVGNPVVVENGYKYSIKYKGLSSGSTATTNGVFNISLKAGIVSDISLNTNEKQTCEDIIVSGRKYTVTYVKGFNVSSLGSTANSCTTVGKSLTCDITLPSITTVEGFKVSGWFISTTKVGNPADTYTLSDGNTKDGKVELIANALDDTPPTVPTITNSSKENWATSATITVASTDLGSGIDSYEWFDGEKWTSDSITITNGIGKIVYQTEMDKTIRFRAIDKFGNISDEATTKVRIDKTAPVCTFEVKSVNYNDTANMAMTCIDSASGIESKKLDASNFTISNKIYGTITEVSAPSEVTNGYKYNITVKGLAAGSFTLGLDAGVINDNAGNTNTSVVSNSITVNKINAVNPTLTSYKGVYDGASHTIDIAGGNGGTIEYSVDKESWSTVKPTRTDVGLTTVYIRVLGDSNHNTTEPVSAKIEIEKRATTCTSSGDGKVYDGAALVKSGGNCTNLVSGHSATFTNTGSITNVGTTANTVSSVVIKSGSIDVSGNYSITKASGTLTVTRATTATTGSCNSLTYNGSSQTLASGASSASYSYNAGVNATSYTVTVTADSNHAFSDGTISKNLSCSIGKKATTCTSGSASRDYNGSALTSTNTGSCTNLVSGHSATFTNTGSITNVGSTANTLSSVVIKSGSTDVSGNYSITKANGTLAVTRAKTATTGSCNSLTYNGSSQTLASGASSASYSDNAGVNATSYTVTVTADSNHAFSDGTTSKKLSCSIGKKAVTVTASSESKTYDGSALSSTTGCSITSGSLVSGNTLTCSNSGSITNKGNVANTLSSVVIKSGSTDVSGNYSITKANGMLTINARPTTCTSGSSSRAYNGSALTNTTGGSCTNLVSGQAATFSGHTGSITNVGSTANTFGSVVIKSGTADVSGNYSITKANGTLTVTRATTATTGSCISPTYNGSSQTLASGASSASYSNNAGVNATSYTVTVTADSNHAFSDGTTSKKLTCSIIKKTIEVPSSPTAKNYTGSAQGSGITCPSGSSAGGTTSATNADTYKQTCTPDGNHQWSDGTTTAKSISWTINKIPAVLSCSNKTYNGATQTGCICNGGTIGGTSSAINAGTYTASCTADSNHTSPSNKSWTISPKSVAVSWGATTSFTMNSLEQGPSASANSGISGETINVKSTKAIGVGKYTSTASCNSVSGGQKLCSNYSLTGTTKEFSIYGITRTATFYANGNTISKSSASCTTTGTSTSCSITAPTITAPANTPTVCGFTNSSNGTTSCSIGSGATITLSSNPTYYAQTYKGKVTHTITWNANGATIGANASSCTADPTYNGIAQGGCSITSTSIARTGYTIYGWNTSSSAETSSWDVGTSRIISSSATYYAITKDTTAPSCGSWSGESTTWTKGSRTISVGCTDSGSGCKQSTYSKTFTSSTTTSNVTLTISDNAGNTKDCSKTANVYLDTGAPPPPTIYRGYQVFNREPHTISCSNCTMTKVEQKADDNDYYTYKVQNTANNSRIIMIPGYDIKNAIGYIQSIDPANSTTNKVYYRMFYNTSATTFTSSSSYTTLNKLYLRNRNKFGYEYAPFKSSINLTKDKSALRMDIIKLNSDNSQVLKYTYSLGAGYVVAPAGQAEILQSANILVLAESSSVTDNADESGVDGVICKYGSDSKTLNSWDVYHDEESGSTTNEKGHYFFVKHFEYSSSNGDTINCSTYDKAGNSSTSVAIKINALKSK